MECYSIILVFNFKNIREENLEFRPGINCFVGDNGAEEELYAGESFYFYPTIVFYGENSKEFGALLTDAVPEENAEIRTIPAGTYVVGYHKGAYEEIQDSFKRIKEWGRNLNLEDTILALNIIDQFVEQDNDNYSTRIEVRIADTK